MVRLLKAEPVIASGDLVGEGAIWCDRDEKLWWVDVRRPCVQSYDPLSGRHEVFALPSDLLVASLMLREQGGMVLATNRGFLQYAPGLDPVPLVNPEAGRAGMRFNDGRCDARGRIWCGSMHEEHRAPLGKLYRLDGNGEASEHAWQLDIPNGLRWSPDDSTFYYADSTRHLIFAADFNIEEGAISNRRIFADVAESGAWPDGAAVDEEGCLWSTQNHGGQVLRFSPEGHVIATVELPTALITSCTFGGRGRSVLFITTGSKRLTPAERASQPLAGSLFAVDAGIRGAPEYRYAG